MYLDGSSDAKTRSFAVNLSVIAAGVMVARLSLMYLPAGITVPSSAKAPHTEQYLSPVYPSVSKVAAVAFFNSPSVSCAASLPWTAHPASLHGFQCVFSSCSHVVVSKSCSVTTNLTVAVASTLDPPYWEY